MAALIEEKTGKPVTLEPGSKGIFDIAVDGTIVASKTVNGFPQDDEIIQRVNAEFANSGT